MSDSTSAELWRPVVGFEGYYEVSDHGRVRSVARTVTYVNGIVQARPSVPLKGALGHRGHLRVSLWRDAGRVQCLVHRLVLEAFVGPCPEGQESCHGPGGPGDNRLVNLRWDTRAENMRDRARHARLLVAHSTTSAP